MAVELFDANFYRAANSDLATAGLTTDAQLLSHFQNFGLNEGRAFSPFVDLNFYRSSSSNSDLTAAGLNTNGQLYEHLRNYGVAEGRLFSPFADINFYLAANSDVAQAYGGNREQAFGHLQNYGVAEGRLFSPFFNTNYYLASNPDVARAYGNNPVQALQHFQLKGLNEGRLFSVPFDVNYYRSDNPDLVAAGLNNRQLYDHFQLYGLGEGRASSPFFNASSYLNNNSDLLAAGFNNFQAYNHFVLFGLQEERVVRSSSFDIKFDYRFDTEGFFNDHSRRDSLEAAATIWESILTDEFPDVPIGTTTLGVRDPQTGGYAGQFVNDRYIFTTDEPIDDLVVFVGARNPGNETGATGFVSGYDPNDPNEYRYTSSNFEPWAGSITFNTSTQWFFDATPFFGATPNTSDIIPAENVDFLSTAVHELGHVLGIGTSNAFDSFVSGSFFNGPNAKALNGNNPIPLDSDDLNHVQNGFLIGGVRSEALMEPDINFGVRKLPTALDIALLVDIGYQLSN